jgi:two-component system nitrate/nitrite response regulator NarL
MEAGPDLSSLNANTRHWGAVTDPVSLLIADHAPARLGIKMALGPEVTVCAEADEIEQAIRAAERQRPRVVLLGRGLCADVTVAVRAICLGAPDSAVVVLAPRGDVDDMLDAVRAGAVGYVPGALGADRLHRVLRSVIADEAVVPRAMVTDLLSCLGAGSQARRRWPGGPGRARRCLERHDLSRRQLTPLRTA